MSKTNSDLKDVWTQTERIKTRVKSVGNQTFSFDSHLNAMNGISDEKLNKEFLDLIDTNEEVVSTQRTKRLRKEIKFESEVTESQTNSEITKSLKKPKSEDNDSDFEANEEELNNASDEEWTQPKPGYIKSKGFRCQFKDCSLLLKSRKGLQRHEERHKKEGSHTCDYEGCGYRALNKFQLHSHMRKHSNDYPFVCLYEDCHRKFTRVTHLRRHQMTVHNLSEVGGQPSTSSVSLFECKFDDCSAQFNDYKKFLIHKKSHTKQQMKCSEDGCEYKSFSKYHLVRHHYIVHSKEGPFVCLCGMSFKVKDDYTRHACPQKPFVCEHIGCGLEFKERKAFKRHKQTHGAPQFKCEWEDCSAAFVEMKEFNRHMNRHKGVFKCDFDGCQYRGPTNSQLRQHVIRHSEVTPFKCSVNGCQHSYKSAAGLRDHELSVHPLEFEDFPWIECTDSGCDYKTKSIKRFQHHMTLHTKPHICDVCQKRFRNTGRLAQHMSVHSDVRYPCDWPGCDLTFKRLDNKKDHMNVHTSEKIHRCDWPGCDKTFLIKSRLYVHVFQHKRTQRPIECRICGTRSKTPLQHENHMKTHENQPKEPLNLKSVNLYNNLASMFSI